VKSGEMQGRVLLVCLNVRPKLEIGFLCLFINVVLKAVIQNCFETGRVIFEG
jgi:hypothetical protein